MKNFFFLLFFSFCFTISNAQYFQTGQDPASIKWRQINSENFQLIYPDYFENQAQKLANVLEKVYDYGSYSLNYKPKKISVILHTQTVKSNGLVAWAPKRSEFYTTPHQSIYPQDWLEQLAIHEFRHVVQIDKINSEIPVLIKLLLAEQGTALVFGAYLPWWFIEGDAVVTETALSNYGRGRFPSFLMEHKALAVEKGNYKYDKAYNGSYKNFVPDHYKLGYYMVGSTRAKFGASVWDSVITRVGEKPFSLNPFNKALKLNTGLNKVQLYKSVFDSLRSVWIEEDGNYKSLKFEIISPKNKTYANYNFNHWLNDSIIISYKTSLSEIPAFVKIGKNGREEKLFHPGIIFNESVNYCENLIVWSEQIPDPRWTHSGSSLIRIFNINTGNITEIRPEFKSFSPAISPDKLTVALVESDFSNNFYLSVYSVLEGKLLSRINTSDNNYLFTPEWINNHEIAVVLLTEQGKRLAKIDIVSEEVEVLINKDLGELKQPKLAANELLFISSYSGKNSLYSYSLVSGKTNLLFAPRFGVESPAYSASKNETVVSNYTADGFQLIKLPMDSIKIPLNEVVKKVYQLAENLGQQEIGIPDFSIADTVKYTSEKYSKPANLLNFHSWAPAFINVNTQEISPGVSIMSQNKLGTAETILGYKWDVAGKTSKFYAGYTFKGWYPLIDFEISSGNQASEYTLINQLKNDKGEIVRSDTSLQRFTWKETNADLGIRIPFNLSKGTFNRLLQPEIKYEFTHYKHNTSTPDQFFAGNFQSIIYRVYFQQLLRQSYQDVYPNFGLVLDVNYRHSPLGKTDLGNLTTAQSVFYLPGFLANHGIKIYSGVQNKKITDEYSFSDAIRYPRGWGRINTNRMLSFAIDYKFPIFYPEWSLGSLAYLKRVNASLFVDYAAMEVNSYEAQKKTGTFSKNISSLGLELTSEMNFLRFYAPVEIGFNVSYLPEMQSIYSNFQFSIDFTSL